MEDTETNDLSFNYDFFDLSKFGTSGFIKGQLYKIDKIYNESEIYVKKHLATLLEFYSKSEIYTMIREMTIISQLNYPSILKYIGYNPDDAIFIPHVIMEYSPNGSLYDFFEKDSEKFSDMTNYLKWNDTKKLIYFYGIASGMAYLHSLNIIHRDLKPCNIFLDKYLYPKISGFNISKELGKKDVLISTNMKGTPAYLAPEIYLNKEYSKSSDVYSFGLIMYEILSGEKPFINVLSPKEMKRIVCDEASRPPIPETIYESYRNLIERCWSQEPESRPTFEMIVTELKTNLNFITQDVDEDEFHKYIQYIDETQNSFNPLKRLNYVEHSMKSAVIENKERNLKVNLGNIYKTELNNIQVEYDLIDIKKYKKEKLLNIDHSDKIYKISDKQTGAFYQAKKRCGDISLFNQSLCYDINFNLEVNHPSFLRFIGCSLVDFKGNDKLMIITDYATNGTLENILEIDMKNQDRNPNELILNPTKRLIILYGIASGMSYLHSHNIIHCSLNTFHVYLDEFLFPRITEFNESELISENPIPNIKDLPIEHQIYSDIYYPPELALFALICSASDVYSFSIIAYQLITNEKPFEKSQIAFEQISSSI